MPPEAVAETPSPSTQPAAPAAEPRTPGEQARSDASTAPASPAASTPSSPPASTNEQKNDWFRNAFNSRRYGDRSEARSEADPGTETERSGAGEQRSVPPSAEGAPAGGQEPKEQAEPAQRGDTLTLTPQELERRVQSETDRRLAKHQREEAQRRKQEERKRLRETDPYGFAKLDAEQEAEAETLQKQLERAHEITLSSLHAYDASVLDPLMRAVPEAERQKILDAIEPGIPGRGQAATKALAVLEKHFKAQGVSEARKTLLNDQSFIKEVLAKYGGGRIEPEPVAAASAPRPAFSANAWLRAEGNRVRGLSPR